MTVQVEDALQTFYIPNIKLVGYGRAQTYQIVCLRCKELFFEFETNRELKHLFCDWCEPDMNLLSKDNFSSINYLGNVVGWEVKCAADEIRRSRRNYKKCYIRDNYTCQYCDYKVGLDISFRPLHIDHLKPWSAAGSNKLDNLVVACETCNTVVSNKIFSSFHEKKAYILERINPNGLS